MINSSFQGFPKCTFPKCAITKGIYITWYLEVLKKFYLFPSLQLPSLVWNCSSSLAKCADMILFSVIRLNFRVGSKDYYCLLQLPQGDGCVLMESHSSSEPALKDFN